MSYTSGSGHGVIRNFISAVIWR